MNAHVKDTVSRLLTQAKLDDRFRADFEKEVSAVYVAGAASTQTIVKSAPLTDAEIALLRDNLRAQA